MFNIRAIFWDNDGVLVDTERLYFRANAEVLADEGFELTPKLFQKHWLFDSRGILAIGSAQGWSEGKIALLRARRDEIYSSLISSAAIALPRVEETIAQVPKGVIQAIVTSSKRDHFEIIHRRTGLLPYFQFVLTEGDYARSKPQPDPYLAALERAAVPREECLVIEDSERGLRAATAAGIRCWVLPSDLTRGSDFSAADRLLDDVTQVLECFRVLPAS